MDKKKQIVGYVLGNVIVCKKCFELYLKEGSVTSDEIEEIIYSNDEVEFAVSKKPTQYTCEQCLCDIKTSL